MKDSFILSRAGRLLFPLLLLLSLLVLYRGHNLPGGGFIGGLLAAASFLLVGLGDGMAEARRRGRIPPAVLMGVGLGVAVISGLFGMLGGAPFLTGLWLPSFSLPLLGTIHLGTPLLFDVGVYLTVIGFVLHTVFSLADFGWAEQDEEEPG